MQTYYFTFGQVHTHPDTGERMKDYWIEIRANDAYQAQMEMYRLFGQKWANQYEEKEFKKHDKDYFPKGCYAKYKKELRRD